MTSTVEQLNPIHTLRQWPESPIDETTLEVIAGITTDAHVDHKGLGRTTQDLTDLHFQIRAYCSDRYRDLSDADPSASKEEINTEPNLVALNAVRKTLHQAMVRKQKSSTRRFFKYYVIGEEQ